MFLYSHWLQLPLPTRIAIANKLGIAKVRSTHVVGDQIADDGYNVKDIENAVSVESLQTFLNSKEDDLKVLWGLLVDEIEGRVQAPVATSITPEEQEQFNQEYEERTGKEAPREKVKKTIKKVAKKIKK